MPPKKAHRLEFQADLTEGDGVNIHVYLWVNVPSIPKKLWGNMLWSRSYRAGSRGGAPVAVIHSYIEQQQTPQNHRSQETYGVQVLLTVLHVEVCRAARKADSSLRR